MSSDASYVMRDAGQETTVHLHASRITSAASHATATGGSDMTLAQAIERREWEVAALLLIVAASRVLARLPQGSTADLLALLEAEDD